MAHALAAAPAPVVDYIRGGQANTGNRLLDTPTEATEGTQDRIAYLFDHDVYDLPLRLRPRSHKNGTTWLANYGRMRPDAPAPTITTGFHTPGRGRFVHPEERRTLTPAEAARLQGFPKTYVFTVRDERPPTRSQICTWIGNAVPMHLGYAAALSAIGPDLAR